MSGSQTEKYGVLFVENNPNDRAVVDEILADTPFELCYTHEGKSLHKDEQFEDILTQDEAGQRFPVVLFDLGLDVKTERILATEGMQTFLSDWNSMTQARDMARRGDKLVGEAATLKEITPVWYLMTQTLDQPERLYGVVSHFVSSRTESVMRFLVSPNPRVLEDKHPEEQDRTDLVFNKAQLSDLVQRLKRAVRVWKNPAKIFSPVAYWPAMDLYGDGTISSFFVLAQRLFKRHPRGPGGPAVIYIVDSAQVLQTWDGFRWKNAFQNFLQDKNVICRSLSDAENKAEDGIDIVLSPRGEELNPLEDVDKLPEVQGRAVFHFSFGPNVLEELGNLRDSLEAFPYHENTVVLLPTTEVSDPKVWHQVIRQLLPPENEWKRSDTSVDEAIPVIVGLGRPITVPILQQALKQAMQIRKGDFARVFTKCLEKLLKTDKPFGKQPNE